MVVHKCTLLSPEGRLLMLLTSPRRTHAGDSLPDNSAPIPSFHAADVFVMERSTPANRGAVQPDPGLGIMSEALSSAEDE